MMPRGLYEILPYFYLSAGVAGGFIIDSSLIFIGSMLLISAGLLTLYMRYQYRAGSLVTEQTIAERRQRVDRRSRDLGNFPLVDSGGQLIISDRRLGDRRMNDAGFA